MARKKTHYQLTPVELDIVNILWQDGPATVQKVKEQLAERRDLAYTTVQTMLNVLNRKGKVKRVLKNRAYHYSAALTRDQVASSTVGDLIDRLFGGSIDGLLISMVQTRRLTKEKISELRDLLDRAEEHAEEP